MRWNQTVVDDEKRRNAKSRNEMCDVYTLGVTSVNTKQEMRWENDSMRWW